MITIFTPTFNRAHTIPRLYESLKRQNSKDFEWIVIDDDSTDGTEKLFDEYLKDDNDFKITYEKQTHGGKHRAINKAVKKANYDWFYIVDSDDYISDDAVEVIHKWIKENESDEKIAAVSGSRFNLETNVAMSVPNLLKFNPGLKCLNYERSMYGLDCDKAEIYRTSILKSHPFPEFENEYFVTEAVVWDSIAIDGYYIAFYPNVIYYCKYYDDGLTKNDANGLIGFSKNFLGFLEYVKVQIKCHGINAQTKGLVIAAIEIGSKKNFSISNIAEKIEVNQEQLIFIYKENKMNIFQRAVRKLNHIINKGN